jgi:hypothetical protein
VVKLRDTFETRRISIGGRPILDGRLGASNSEKRRPATAAAQSFEREET